MGSQIPVGSGFDVRAQFLDQLNQPLDVHDVAVTIVPVITGPALTVSAPVDLSESTTLPVGNWKAHVTTTPDTALGDYVVTWTATDPTDQPCTPATETITLINPADIGVTDTWCTLDQVQTITGRTGVTQPALLAAQMDIEIAAKLSPADDRQPLSRHREGRRDLQVLAAATAWRALYLQEDLNAAEAAGGAGDLETMRVTGVRAYTQPGMSVSLDDQVERAGKIGFLDPRSRAYLLRLSKISQRIRTGPRMVRPDDRPAIYRDLSTGTAVGLWWEQWFLDRTGPPPAGQGQQ